MNWVLKTLVSAVVAGIGLKIGSEIVEGVKKTLKEHRASREAGACKEKEKAPEDGAGEEAEEDGGGEAGLPGDVVELGDAPAPEPVG